MRHDLDALIAAELASAERAARADDERMAAACRGEPFYGVGKESADSRRIVGLTDFVPDTSAKSLALLAWFASRGANGAGQWPDDPDDFTKQNKARDEFEAWWAQR